ncbi:MAG: UDP-N-acetylmuramoyl-L-alanyl-D-glutamate--2,6-diaminopimelate ligase [Deltaproteobacteria bacterium]|nr:UDP-N-acetylmuramoyl-L-alanyl-D-glutamate--2,6-diaminopimelate ligase [Deltaproteobacteria bacterium]
MAFRGDPRLVIQGVAHDSRRVQEGDLFVAIAGTKADGNLYVQEALRRGAVAVVTENSVESYGLTTTIRVADSRIALSAISANFYEHPSRELILAGVTGTNGKTTTALLLESIFRSAGYRSGVVGTLAYRWGDRERKAPMTTPESLDLQRLLREMIDDGVTHVAMEVSSHALALGRVSDCAFDAAIFTNLSQDHLDFHGSMEAYFECKGRMYRECLQGRGKSGLSVINLDDAYGRRLASGIPSHLWSYSVADENATVWVKELELRGDGIRATLAGAAGGMRIRSTLLGRLNLYNVLGAVTAAIGLGVPRRSISEGIWAVSHVDGRLQRVPVPAEFGFEVIVDYAHTPDAMEKSLGCLREMTRGRLIVVFGCGGDRDRGKRPLMGAVAARFGDLVILTSDNPRSERPEDILAEIEPGVVHEGVAYCPPDEGETVDRGYTVEVDRRRGIEIALSWARPGDTVFIGGKCHETYQIVGGDTLPFDDRRVVRDYFVTHGDAGQREAVGN